MYASVTLRWEKPSERSGLIIAMETTLYSPGCARTWLTSWGISFWQCLQVADQNIRNVGLPFGKRPVKGTSRPPGTSGRVNGWAQWPYSSLAG